MADRQEDIAAEGRLQFLDNSSLEEPKNKTETENNQQQVRQDASTTQRAQSASDMRDNTNVPEVDIRTTAFQSQPSLRTAETPSIDLQLMKEMQEKNKKLMVKKYFSLRPGAFESAVEDCKQILDSDKDGQFKNAWLLTEIDHWDHEKERIVMITEKQVIVFKYNYISLHIDDYRRIPLVSCDKIQTGRFVYPKNTMSFPRPYQVGVRIFAGKNKIITTSSKWNPWSKDIPYLTLTMHKASSLLEEVPSHAHLGLFKEAVISAIKYSHIKHAEEMSLEVVDEPISIEVYVGIAQMAHNWGIMGFCRERGSVGF